MDTTKPQKPIKFDLAFTPEIYKYIDIYKKQQKVPTIAGFASRIGTDEASIYAWADKKLKDENGNLTDKFARPKFLEAVNRLKEVQQELSRLKEERLNAKQELFCQLYATNREFFGNGVQTYIEIYEPDQKKPNWYKSACQSASQLLSNIKVFTRINELLEEEGLNDNFVDKQLLFVISQHNDISGKVAAIREYNKLKQRITDKIDHTTKGEKIKQVVGFNFLPPVKSDGGNNPNNQANA